MPQKRAAKEPDWIRGEQLKPPRQRLADSEVDAYLESVLCDLARRPSSLGLRETARVVRYLRRLGLEGVPVGAEGNPDSKEAALAKARLHELGERIWTIFLQCGVVEAASKRATILFLKRHRATYLAHLDLDFLIAWIEKLELPDDADDPFGPPAMVSASVTRRGQSNPRLQDDLTERIYTAYQVLRRQRIKRSRQRIAETLNRLQITKARGGQADWTWQDVNDRIKSHSAQLGRRLGKQAQGGEAWRDYLADMSLLIFREKQKLGQ